LCVGAIICKSKNKWYYDVGKHKAHPLLLLLLCLAACFLGRPYEYSEVLDETLGAEVLQQQRMAGLP